MHFKFDLECIYTSVAQLHRASVFGTDRQGLDNSLIKIITFCTHSEVDITIVFGTIMPSSSLGGCTKYIQ